MSDMLSVERRPISVGDRVVCEGFSYGEGAFAGWSDDCVSCPDDHISWPGVLSPSPATVAPDPPRGLDSSQTGRGAPQTPFRGSVPYPGAVIAAMLVYVALHGDA